jgi:trimethylamine:corrinoid methyltransferase-like protein
MKPWTRLAFELMCQVIRHDGVFLGERHTIRHMRKGALWVPSVSEGSADLVDGVRIGAVARARARAREIVQTHQVDPLPEDTRRHLDEIRRRAQRELGRS